MIIWTFISTEARRSTKMQTMLRAMIALAVLYPIHVRGVGSRFTDTGWQTLAECTKDNDKSCSVGMNPGYLGTINIPSDRQLAIMGYEDRLSFRTLPP
jgi:hypothetical protein